jgi:hypothetical protein
LRNPKPIVTQSNCESANGSFSALASTQVTLPM